nr:hypothetical protein CFP56_24069 [Quercus suber]
MMCEHVSEPTFDFCLLMETTPYISLNLPLCEALPQDTRTALDDVGNSVNIFGAPIGISTVTEPRVNLPHRDIRLEHRHCITAHYGLHHRPSKLPLPPFAVCPLDRASFADNCPLQLGGFTLTTTILYLSLSLHRQNRIHQAGLLHGQTFLLRTTVDPPSAPSAPTPREIPAGLWETAKDRWNAELESGVRKVQSTDWDAVRERMEESVSSMWRGAFAKGQEGVQSAAEGLKK